MTAHDVYVLTSDAEGYCNPHDWVEVFASLDEAEAWVTQRERDQIEGELVGDRTYTDPPLEPGASGGLVVEVDGDTSQPDCWVLDVRLWHPGDQRAGRLTEYIVWRRPCPHAR